MTISAFPEKMGLVESLAHPGGNITGLSHAGPEVTGKRLQLLKQLAPKTVAHRRARQLRRARSTSSPFVRPSGRGGARPRAADGSMPGRRTITPPPSRP